MRLISDNAPEQWILSGLLRLQREALELGMSRRRGSVPRAVAHKQTPPDVPPGKKGEPEVTGSAGPSSAPAADQLSAAEREERWRQAEIAINRG